MSTRWSVDLVGLVYTSSSTHPQVWETLEKDPLFAHQNVDLTLDKQRELSFKRVKRLHEYDFVPEDEMMSNPAKFYALARAVQMYDVSVFTTYGLSTTVRNLVLYTSMIFSVFIITAILFCCKNEWNTETQTLCR